MQEPEGVRQGRDCYQRHAWGEAYRQLAAAHERVDLSLADLELLAFAAFLTGRDEACGAAMMKAHAGYLAQDDLAGAVRCAFWHAFGRMNLGDFAQASGWLARAHRLLEENALECVECGYVLIPNALETFEAGDNEAGKGLFAEIGAIGERFRDPTLIAVSQLGVGHALIRMGSIDDGLRMLDEMMVAVVAGEVTPVLVGLCYCAVIGIYHELYDLRRAQEWTEALSRSYDAEPELVAYRGDCLAHRAEIMQLHGEWSQALGEVGLACARLTNPPGQPTAGPAFYQQAELYRLRGQFQKAEESYRIASQHGKSPQPGLALLRLAQGQIEAAAGAIRREVAESGDVANRAKLLGACVEIMLAIGDGETARGVADQLAAVAAALDAPMLNAARDQAVGAVLLAEEDPRGAIEALRRACSTWQSFEIPYEVARTRVLIGRCCRELGDEDTAQMEFDAAARVFRQLGAEPDIARIDALARKNPVQQIGGLTSREVEVLRLIAAGKTNRAIAADLFLSEKTIARHVSNIFSKLGVASRSAATAYAFEHQIV
jgi:DNA-binding CsgD family transcriptional regulator